MSVATGAGPRRNTSAERNDARCQFSNLTTTKGALHMTRLTVEEDVRIIKVLFQ
jgi:hypothetical protein